jgi:hypothetical protein
LVISYRKLVLFYTCGCSEWIDGLLCIEFPGAIVAQLLKKNDGGLWQAGRLALGFIPFLVGELLSVPNVSEQTLQYAGCKQC